MVKWEYEFIEFYRDKAGIWYTDCSELDGQDYDSLSEALNAVGEIGWEMCGSSPHSIDFAWAFKRPVS